jgi:two-component system, sensor histidine kinase and response regulator
MKSPPLIDSAVFDDLLAHIGNDAMRSVIDLFREEARGHTAIVAEAAAQPGDTAQRERARRAAHSLKSSAGQIGAAALAQAAAEAERAAERPAADLAPAAARLQRCLEETVAALPLRLNELR